MDLRSVCEADPNDRSRLGYGRRTQEVRETDSRGTGDRLQPISEPPKEPSSHRRGSPLPSGRGRPMTAPLDAARLAADPVIATAVDLFGAEVLAGRTRPTLREYQTEAVGRHEDELAAGRNPLYVAPTGSGKAVTLAAEIERARQRGQRIVFVAPWRELIAQTSAKLDDIGVEHGVILAGADPRAGLDCPVQVASVD